MNLPFMNTVNVVFSHFICYLILFSVIVILDLNLLGLGTLCLSQAGNEITTTLSTSKQIVKMFTVLLHEIFTGIVVFDNISIHHKQQNSQRKDNILIDLTAPCW